VRYRLYKTGIALATFAMTVEALGAGRKWT
jgi:hypothetical protein